MKRAKTRGPAPAATFAHLLGLPKAENEKPEETDNPESDELKAKRAEWEKLAEEDPERKQKEDESDEDYVSRMEEMDAAEEEDDTRAEEGEESAEDDGKEAKAARASERARCAKIIAHGINNNCANQAFVFAFDTMLTAAQAIAAMGAAKLDGGKRGGLAQLMAGVEVPKVGADVTASGIDLSDPNVRAKAAAQEVIRAAAKARGEKV